MSETIMMIYDLFYGYIYVLYVYLMIILLEILAVQRVILMIILLGFMFGLILLLCVFGFLLFYSI